MTHLPDLFPEAGLRVLGRLFFAEGKWHKFERRFDQAAQSHFNAMQLGSKVRSGVVIHKLVGQSVAKSGQESLLVIKPKLSAKISEQIAHELLRLLDEEEPLDEVWERERKFARQFTIRGLSDFPREFVQSPREAIEGLLGLPKAIGELKKSVKELASRSELIFRLR